jgi:hypothetical protein
LKKLGLAYLILALLCLGGAAWAEGGDSIPAEGDAGLKGDTSAIAQSIGAIDGDLGTMDDIANAILGEIGGLKGDIGKLQARIKELQALNGEAGEEIARLNAKVAVLVDRAQSLGDRYEKMAGLAQGYKTKYKRTRIAAFVLGAATLALGGVLVGVAASK